VSVDAIGSISPAELAPPTSFRTEVPAPGGDFQAVLQRQLESPRDEIDRIRSQVASFRNGGVLDRAFRSGGSLLAPVPANLSGGGVASIALAGKPMRTAPVSPEHFPAWIQQDLARQATGDPADPYGWRALSREIADSVIGPDYGPMFERQIHLESGFAPDVVYGLRVSTAGAEGIAQLMPQYYQDVNRRDPRESLMAGARTMAHNLSVWDGDVRKALASYNAGLGRVQQLVRQHGDRWEQGLPAETKHYLAYILGDARPNYVSTGSVPGDHVVFGGRGPGGVISAPIDQIGPGRSFGDLLQLTGIGGAPVRAPSDGVVASTGGGTVTLDHGNGWTSTLEGLSALLVAPGSSVQRGDPLGALAASGLLNVALTLDGRPLDPARYLLTAS
jgi:murein DD-endopeptidase MepM/ murein hydrolase activator NlpD